MPIASLSGIFPTRDDHIFTVAINGQQHTYNNDKDGKRQAILAGLAQVETIILGEEVYLSTHLTQQVVATVLYPEESMTQEAYQLVCRVTEKACTHAGFGAQEQLEPPHVSFATRGAYRKKYPRLNKALLETELALAGVNSYTPQHEMTCHAVWREVARTVYGKAFRLLDENQQAQIISQTDEIAAAASWQKEDDSRPLYTRPLPIDEETLRAQLTTYLSGKSGQPVAVDSLLTQAQRGAYGRRQSPLAGQPTHPSQWHETTYQGANVSSLWLGQPSAHSQTSQLERGEPRASLLFAR